MRTADFSKLPLHPETLLLDAGCGTGRHATVAYSEYGVKVIGIDTNWEDLTRTAATLYFVDGDGAENGRSWLTSMGDVTRLPFKDNSFDIVICSEVLEHVPDNKKAAKELVRVLKPGKDLVVSVPRYLPERICWALSEAYHNEPGGHIRIYTKRGLLHLLESAGAKCWDIRYTHGLHAPYWWLKCLVGHTRQDSRLVNVYRKFLEWDIMEHPPLTRGLEKMLNPLIAKSVVLYLKKGF